MAILTLSEAARQWHLGRSSLYRAVKRGRLTLTTRPDGRRGVDTSELIRAFGEPAVSRSPANRSADDHGSEADRLVVRLLQSQIDQLAAQLAQTQIEKSRLLTLLEAEQASRRDLEVRLLAPPPPEQRFPPPLRLAQSLVGQAVRIQWQSGVEAWPYCRVLAVKPRKRRIEVEAIDAATGAQGDRRWVSLEAIVRIEPADPFATVGSG